MGSFLGVSIGCTVGSFLVGVGVPLVSSFLFKAARFAAASSASTAGSGETLDALIERMNEASKEEERKRGEMQAVMDKQNLETAARMDSMEGALKAALGQCSRMEQTMTGLQSSANANAAAILDLANKNDTAFKLLMIKLDTLSGDAPTPAAAAAAAPTSTSAPADVNAHYGPTRAKVPVLRASPFAPTPAVVDVDNTPIVVNVDATASTV